MADITKIEVKDLSPLNTKTAKKKDKKDEPITMFVKVYGPFKTYFEGQANSISAINDTGPFDILPRHHNFMTLLNPCEVVVITDRSEDRFQINKGVMHVKSDRVVVFLDV